MGFARLEIDARLRMAQVAIDNALAHAYLRQPLAEYGYDETELRAGRALYEWALALHRAQKVAYGAQYAASAELLTAWRAAERIYARHVKLARVAFRRQAGMAHRLGLNGARKRQFTGALAQAQQFYATALADTACTARLAQIGLTQALLQEGQAALEAVVAANLALRRERGAAQQATKTRDAALAELGRWMHDYLTVARVALDAHPQLLEALGVQV